MFPIGDQNIRGATRPFVTWGLVAINVIVFIYQLTLSPAQLEDFFYSYGVVPAVVGRGENLFSLLSSMFMHGGWMHIASNMLFLFIFGDNIEAVLGKVGYLVFYLLGGLAASAAHILLNWNAQVPSIGASGAIAAVMGAYLVMFPRSRVRVLVFLFFRVAVTEVTALAFLGIWFVTQLFSGVASLGVPTAQTGGGVAYWAHIGGFAMGLIVGAVFRGRAQRLVREI